MVLMGTRYLSNVFFRRYYGKFFSKISELYARPPFKKRIPVS